MCVYCVLCTLHAVAFCSRRCYTYAHWVPHTVMEKVLSLKRKKKEKYTANSQSTTLPTPVTTTEAHITACAYNGYMAEQSTVDHPIPGTILMSIFSSSYSSCVNLVRNRFRHVYSVYDVRAVAHLCFWFASDFHGRIHSTKLIVDFEAGRTFGCRAVDSFKLPNIYDDGVVLCVHSRIE